MKRILIIDDDPDLLNGLRALLTNKGYMTKILQDGNLTVGETEFFHPDIILMDVHIGQVDGREICLQLKHNKKTKHIPVIMISADANQHEIISKYEADDFMEKPFSLRILYSKLESLTA